MLTAEAADEPDAEPTLAAATEVQRRNKLEHEKANKLVALFHNLRLLSRMAKPAYSEPAIGWNQEDDAAGVVKYGVANYEPARKSAAALVRPPQPALCLAPVRPPLDHDEMPLLM